MRFSSPGWLAGALLGAGVTAADLVPGLAEAVLAEVSDRADRLVVLRTGLQVRASGGRGQPELAHDAREGVSGEVTPGRHHQGRSPVM
jgi:hypothetical protein